MTRAWEKVRRQKELHETLYVYRSAILKLFIIIIMQFNWMAKGQNWRVHAGMRNSYGVHRHWEWKEVNSFQVRKMDVQVLWRNFSTFCIVWAEHQKNRATSIISESLNMQIWFCSYVKCDCWNTFIPLWKWIHDLFYCFYSHFLLFRFYVHVCFAVLKGQ